MKNSAFSYMLWSPTKQAEYEKFLEHMFVDYVQHSAGKAGKDVSSTFRTWWMWRGPTGFHTTEDALQCKAEIYSYIVGKLLQVAEPEPEAAASESV